MIAKIIQRNLSKFAPEATPYDVRDTDLVGFILRIHPTGRKVYYCQYARGKRERLGTVPAVTPEQAREKAKTMLAGIMLGGETPSEARRKAQAYSLSTYLDTIYGPWVETNRKSGAASLARLKSRFLGTLGDELLPDLSLWAIESWRTQRRQAGTAVATINRDLAALRAALSKAVEWGLLSEHPLKDLKPLRSDRAANIVRYLTPAEEQRLRAALIARDRRIIQGRANGNSWREQRGYASMPAISGPFGDHLTAMVLISLNTGVRRGELLSLTWSAIDTHNNVLTVSGESSKSGQTRHIPLNSEAQETLAAWGIATGQTGLLFKARQGGKMVDIKKSWSAVLKAAGIREFRWHDLRHHFASRLVMQGASLYVIKQLLGHSTIAITEKYAHLAPEHKSAAVALLDQERPT